MPRSCSTNSNNSLTVEEKKVFDLQHSKPVFARYGDVELLTEVQLLLYKISVITGWKLPESEEYLTVLADQFFKKIREDYQHLNTNEVEYAFRQNTHVKDWGKSFNLSLIDAVLIPYIAQRREVKEFVERMPQKERLLPMQADWKELCEINYQAFLTGKYNVDLWPWQMYDEFVKCGMMEEEVYHDFLKVAYKRLITKECETQKEHEQLLEIKKELLNHHAVIALSKRLAVKLLYYTAKEHGIENLFVVG